MVIKKFCLTEVEARIKQNLLEEEYGSVKLIKYPYPYEMGTYVFEVHKCK